MIPAMPSRSSWSRRCISNMMLVDGTLCSSPLAAPAQTASAPAGLVGSKVALPGTWQASVGSRATRTKKRAFDGP